MMAAVLSTNARTGDGAPRPHTAVVTSGHGPFSPRVLTQRAMEAAVLPPSPALNSAQKIGRVVMVRNVSAAGSNKYWFGHEASAPLP